MISVPTDVPVHRPSVGAMGWQGTQVPPKITKPYVYRGTGVDTVTAHMGRDASDHEWAPVREPKPTGPRPLTHEQRVKRHTALQRRHDARVAEEARARARAHRARKLEKKQAKKRRRLDIQDISTWGEREPREFPETPAPEPTPEPVNPPQYRRPARPSPGWRPMTGADLDALFAPPPGLPPVCL